MFDIRINDSIYPVPADLSEIELGRFIEYWDRYGRQLDADLAEICSRDYEDEFERALDISANEDREALSWYGYWTGLDFFQLSNEDALPLIAFFRHVRQLITESTSASYDFPVEIEWQGEQWEIQNHKVTPKSTFTFNELLTSKEVMRQIRQIGKGKWDALPWLCAVFLRKKGEKFSDDLVMDGGERLALMHTLPLNYALQVAFFLTASLNISIRVFRYSREVEKLTGGWSSTSKPGDGSPI